MLTSEHHRSFWTNWYSFLFDLPLNLWKIKYAKDTWEAFRDSVARQVILLCSWALLRGLFRTCHLLNSSWHGKDTENAKGVMKLERFLKLLWTELRHFMVVWNDFARKHLQSGLFLERKHFQTFKLPKVWYFESQWLIAGETVILCTTILSLPSISYFALWTFFLPIAVMQRACKRAYELLCKSLFMLFRLL